MDKDRFLFNLENALKKMLIKYLYADQDMQTRLALEKAVEEFVAENVSEYSTQELIETFSSAQVALGLFLEYQEAKRITGSGRQKHSEETLPSGPSTLSALKPVDACPQNDHWTEPLSGMVFMRVPGGCYPMGSGDWDDDGLEDEKPVHQVCLDDFWMGRYVVTVGQYMRFCEETKDHLPQWLEKESRFNIHTGTDPFYRKLGQALIAENSPVVGVSWHDAVAFAEWLSDKSPFEFGLPSEAQWEYAARSGGKPEKYAGGDRVDLLAWYFKNSAQTLHPVGSKAPNGLDLYDMSGNVCEWCQDIYSKTAYARHFRKNPVFSGEGTCRVVRGGSWNYGQRDVRCSDRGIYLPEVRSNDLGFRLVRLS